MFNLLIFYNMYNDIRHFYYYMAILSLKSSHRDEKMHSQVCT